MCKNDMKYAVCFITILFALFVSSCTVPLELSILNNTPYKILVALREENITIEPGESKAISGVSYAHFSISSEQSTFSYEMPSILSSVWVWKGWGPFPRRVIYVQLEEDGGIWMVGPDKPSPVTTFGKQPDGFPIRPNT
jgi:hypothetical protein